MQHGTDALKLCVMRSLLRDRRNRALIVVILFGMAAVLALRPIAAQALISAAAAATPGPTLCIGGALVSLGQTGGEADNQAGDQDVGDALDAGADGSVDDVVHRFDLCPVAGVVGDALGSTAPAPVDCAPPHSAPIAGPEFSVLRSGPPSYRPRAPPRLARA